MCTEIQERDRERERERERRSGWTIGLQATAPGDEELAVKKLKDSVVWKKLGCSWPYLLHENEDSDLASIS